MTHACFDLNYSEMVALGLSDESIDMLQENVEKIRELLVFDDETEDVIGLSAGGFTHNIIGMTLQVIAKNFSNQVANKVLLGFGLDELGWSTVE